MKYNKIKIGRYKRGEWGLLANIAWIRNRTTDTEPQTSSSGQKKEYGQNHHERIKQHQNHGHERSWTEE